MIYLILFLEFAKISLICVGGGYASMPLIQAVVVDNYHWLTLPEFIDIFTISQMTPGPIGINAATFAGTKVAGLPGAVAATMGFVTPSLFLCIILAKIMFKYGDLGSIHGILNGLRPAVMALIAAACVSFVLLAVWNVEDVPTDWSTFDAKGVVILLLALAAAQKKVGVIKILISCGILGLALGINGF
ncbi:MAG: chromate transporter [Selenomonadaceae bacterium]|nr:chromate transporter [Selenomonadaceae bacterium]MBR1859674.1 chromate transporter [Selenomonadaceae bacterium]